MHRLDRPVSGLIAWAKRAPIQEALKDGGLHRRYHALVRGVVEHDRGTIDAPLGRDPDFDYRRAIVPVEQGGQSAVTRYVVLDRRSDRTLVELALETGRTHQLRVHLASIGHPIVGDTLYDGTRQPATTIALHACEIRLRHPVTGTELVCASPASFAQ
jgi:23S rRNA pseudouridine1911/1915/1917 synthase